MGLNEIFGRGEWKKLLGIPETLEQRESRGQDAIERARFLIVKLKEKFGFDDSGLTIRVLSDEKEKEFDAVCNSIIYCCNQALRVHPDWVEALYKRAVMDVLKFKLYENEAYSRRAGESADRIFEMDIEQIKYDTWEALAKIYEDLYKWEKSAECKRRAKQLKILKVKEKSISVKNLKKTAYKSNKEEDNINEMPEESPKEDPPTPVFPDEAPKNGFDTQVEGKCVLPTLSGVNVQSYGEQLISNFLYTHHIDFDYDTQITLKGEEANTQGFKTSWVRPDFFLTEFNIVIEYWGMKGTPDYDIDMDRKKRLYKESKTPFISIFKKDLDDLNGLLAQKLKRLGCDVKVEQAKITSFSSIKKDKPYKCPDCGKPLSRWGKCASCKAKTKRRKYTPRRKKTTKKRPKRTNHKRV